MNEREISKKIFNQSLKVIPGGVNSPVRSFKSLGMDPVVVESGKGAEIRDVDGNEYIDFCMSWGALILGHAPPNVVETTKKQMELGSTYGIATTIEMKLAEKVCRLVPNVEKVRFVSSGTEATMSALRLARGYTGKEIVIKFNGCYHGHSDCFLKKAGSGATDLNEDSFSKGVPKEMIRKTVSLPFNDLEAFQEAVSKTEIRENLAAVILEPIAGNMGVVPARQEFIDLLRKETKASGALLIFDEVMTGFRVSLSGAQAVYGDVADIVCMGKVIGGGFPMAALGGKKAIMDALAPLGSVYQAGTLSGNPIACAAGLRTLETISQKDFFQKLERKTSYFLDMLSDAIEGEKACLQSIGSMFTLFWGVESVSSQEDLEAMDVNRFKDFFRFMLEKGIYWPPSAFEAAFISEAHTGKQLEYVADCVKKYCQLCLV